LATPHDLLRGQFRREPGGEGGLESGDPTAEDHLPGLGHALQRRAQQVAIAEQFLLGEVERVHHRGLEWHQR
jgi:hypothetical protein